MQTYRVSNVERYRQYERSDDIELEQLIADIRGESPPSEKMAAGIAFHRALELAEVGEDVSVLRANGYAFHFNDDFSIALPVLRELRANKIYLLDGVPITISGACDAIEGHMVVDHKSTARFDPERFFSGYQWRLYLTIFGASQFRWNVFEIQEIGEGSRQYSVFAQHTLDQWRYPAMEQDCQALVERFARFVRVHVEPVAEVA
jgi:hypothetical protein